MAAPPVAAPATVPDGIFPPELAVDGAVVVVGGKVHVVHGAVDAGASDVVVPSADDSVDGGASENMTVCFVTVTTELLGTVCVTPESVLVGVGVGGGVAVVRGSVSELIVESS